MKPFAERFRRALHLAPRALVRRGLLASVRPAMVLLVFLAVVMQIVTFSPGNLETRSSNQYLDQEAFADLVVDKEITLSPGIPKGKIPEYSAEEFTYVSVENGERQWKVLANKAFLYHSEQLAHTRRITAYLYNTEDDTTLVSGQEGKFFMDQRDLEVFGGVKTVLSDGFTLISEYLKYMPSSKTILIPKEYPVQGIGEEKDGKRISFTSQGLTFDTDRDEIILPESVRFVMETTPTAKDPDGDITVIVSDHCVIDRARHLSRFRMDPAKPIPKRFVRITQENLFTKGRRSDLYYGDFAEVLDYMVVHDDVFIQEIPREDPIEGSKKDRDSQPPFRYATAGRADFDTDQDTVTLTSLPQVYENNDTIVGRKIVLHRESGIVEVDHSNTLTEGKQ